VTVQVTPTVPSGRHCAVPSTMAEWADADPAPASAKPPTAISVAAVLSILFN
jgi:hypothetical protein